LLGIETAGYKIKIILELWSKKPTETEKQKLEIES
jgi:hypothetical protein